MKPVRWSNLKFMADSPATYKYVLDHPIEATPAMRFGSLTHALVLGVAQKDYVVYEGQRRGNAWKDFQEENAQYEIVTSDEYARAQDCAAAILADPVCGPLFAKGAREHKMEWEIAGRSCQGTPDLNGTDLVDLKITPLTNPNRLPWHARKMLWHAQVVWYMDATATLGQPVSDVYLVTATPKPPHLCVAYQLTPDTIDLGRRQWRLLFERLRVCEESDQWPGYAQSVVPLDLPEDDLTLTIDGEEIEL